MGTITDVYFLRLLASPSLRVVETWDDWVYLDSIRCAPMLHTLRLLVRGRSSVQCIVSTLRSLRLSKLELVCGGCEKDKGCAVQELVHSSHGKAPPLVRGCMNVDGLCIDCRHVDTLKEVLPWLRGLNEVTLLRRPTEPVVNRLMAFGTVRLKGFHGAYDLGLMLGLRVTWLICTELLTADQLRALKACQRLTVVRLLLQDGAEEGLEGVMKRWQCLRGLNISWVERGRAISGLLGRFYRVREGVLNRAVACAQTLRELHITNARVATTEVVCMLKCLGENLTSFGVSLLGQSDGCARRLCVLMDTMRNCNPELRECFVSDPCPERFRRCRVSSWGKWLTVLLARLRMTVPLLDVEHLSKVTEWLTTRVPDSVEPLREHEFETVEI